MSDKNKKISSLRAKQWRLDNPIASRECNQRYRDKHRQWYRNYCNQWVKDHPEATKANRKKAYEKMVATPQLRDDYNQKIYDYYNKDEETKQKRRDYMREYMKKYRQDQKRKKELSLGI